ncbi:hypothetical protein OIDMADRAFT_132371, partial [Oidiodendron maius Zn]
TEVPELLEEVMQIHSCDSYGSSLWSKPAKISTTLADGEPKLFFLKCIEGPDGRAMLEGEFKSMRALYRVAPENFVPWPYAWGKLASGPEKYFYLSEFIEMDKRKPDPDQLCEKLYQMHKESQSQSRAFGFDINTWRGKLPQNLKRNRSWEKFYVQLLEGVKEQLESVKEQHRMKNSTSEKLEKIVDHLIAHVVKKVLGPLHTEVHNIKPTLIHGYLWDQNVGVESRTGNVFIFDASSFYAHYEMEIALWRSEMNKFLSMEVYKRKYLERMRISHPRNQFEDRMKIYSCYLALHQFVCRDAKYLIEEYGFPS